MTAQDEIKKLKERIKELEAENEELKLTILWLRRLDNDE